MGTLTSCSLGNLNMTFCRRPHDVSNSMERSRLLGSTNSWRNSCFLCRQIWKRENLFSQKGIGKFKSFSIDNNNNNSSGSSSDREDSNLSNDSNLATVEPSGDDEERERGGKEEKSPPISSRPPTISPVGPSYNNFQIDSFKLMELLGPEKVDPTDVKLIKEKLFGYSTFWVTREEPFGDLGEGVLFLGNLRGNREEVFAKLQNQLAEIMGDKFNLFMVEEPNSEGPDPRGGPRVSFGILLKDVSEPGPTTLWQYVIALLLFLLTIGSSVELGIASQINRLPPEVVKFFTDPNAIEPPDMQLLYPFVESALPLAYGVLGVQIFHEVGHFLAAFPRNVKLSIPFFIPNITLGSFGAITQPGVFISFWLVHIGLRKWWEEKSGNCVEHTSDIV